MALEVKTYASDGDYRKDAQRLAKQGWTVSNVTEQTRRSGCMRILLLGPVSIVYKPKPRIIVTYQRQ